MATKEGRESRNAHHLTTGVYHDCRECGATNVLQAWGWKLYAHKPGGKYEVGHNRHKYGYGCSGPNNLFWDLLRDSLLALAPNGARFFTTYECAALSVLVSAGWDRDEGIRRIDAQRDPGPGIVDWARSVTDGPSSANEEGFLF